MKLDFIPKHLIGKIPVKVIILDQLYFYSGAKRKEKNCWAGRKSYQIVTGQSNPERQEPAPEAVELKVPKGSKDAVVLKNLYLSYCP